VKLADLGIAKAIERTDLTKTDTVLGTPAYMAPEQLQGGKVTPAVDVYALATMAFEMVTGTKARRGRTAVEIAHQVVNEPAPDPRDVNPDVPEEAASAIRKGMAREPAHRPRTACDMADRLERSFTRHGNTWHAPITQRMERARPVASVPDDPARTASPSRNVRWVPVIGLLAVALVAVAIAIGSGGGGDDPAPQPAADTGEKAPKKEKDANESAPAPAPPAEEPEESAPPAETEEPPPLDGVPVPSGAGGSAQAERLHLAGYEALEAGDYDRAIDLNTQAIEAFPEGTTWEDDMNYAYALFSLGKALRLADRPDEAIPVLEARLDIPDQQATVQRELDLARQAAGE
jgi:serine/threonine-protein kinase